MKLDAHDIDALRPIIQAATVAILEEIKPLDGRLKDRFAYTEKEAAQLLGVTKR